MEGAPKLHLRSLWPAGAAILVACLIALLSPRWQSTGRLTNLNLANELIPDTYILMSKSRPDRCHVLSRRQATTRRYNANQPGRTWSCVRFGEARDHWFVHHKAKGAEFFIPLERVEDWTYPFLYTYMREQYPEFDLPSLFWTQLFVDRIYRGLYLSMELPFDLRKRDGGSGILRELLVVDGDQLTRFDTRFNPAARLFIDLIADGKFPELAPVPSPLAWLAERCPTAELTLLLSNEPPHSVSLLPLPVTLTSLHETMYTVPAPKLVDERYYRWRQAVDQVPVSIDSVIAPDSREGFRQEFERYTNAFQEVLTAHGTYYQNLDSLGTEWSYRQGAVAGLGLQLGERRR